MPAWNTGKYIADAIRSVIDQTHKNWDILVIDDGSTDNTVAEVERFMSGRDIAIIKHEKNLSVGAATKTGFDNARGPLVAILDSDDMMYPKGLEYVVPHFKKDPKLGFAWTNYVNAQPSRSRPGKFRSCSVPRGKTLLTAFCGGWWGAYVQQFVRLSFYRASPLQINPHIPFCSDRQVALAMGASGCRCKYIAKTTYFYRNIDDPRRIGRTPKKSRERSKNRGQIIARGKRFLAKRRRKRDGN
jgi:glycosyltransferase involved in cell wall biosynthesis